MKILIRNEQAEKWQIVEAKEYTAETELQKLLADTPSLISLEEIRENAAELVAAVREFGLPGSGHTDILAFSSEGDIVVVECKLAANAEIKRKVIGQVLEYGAYLWGMDYEEVDRRVHHRTGKILADLVRESVGDPEWDEEKFRSNVKESLTKGNFVLIIAVDEMNEELSRTIRFLNSCGNPTFAIAALEMLLFQENDIDVLVPQVFGGVSPGSQPPPRPWDKATFFESVADEHPEEVVQILEEIFNWSKNTAHHIGWGRGIRTGSFTFYYQINGRTVSVFSALTSGLITLRYGRLAEVMSYDDLAEFKKKISSIPSFESLVEDSQAFPSFPVEKAFFDHPDNLKKFKDVIKELIDYESMTSSR